MPEYLAPGVYVEEISSGPPPIAGVGTTTTGMVGLTRRGPISGRPTLVTNYGEFVRAFGGPFNFGPTFAAFTDLPYAVRGFFANGGRRLYISRVVPTGVTGATAATTTLRGGLVTRLTRDVQANAQVLPLVTVRGIRNGTTLVLRMTKDGITTDTAVLTVTDHDRTTGQVTVNNAPSTTLVFEARYTTVLTNVDGLAVNGSVTDLAMPTTPKPATFALKASSVGSWGHDVRISAAHRSAGRSVVVTASMAANTNTVPVLSTAGFYANAWVEVDFGKGASEKVYRKVTSVVGSTLVVAGPPIPANAWSPVGVLDTRISTCEFDLALSYTDPVENTVVTERYSGLTLENVPGRYVVDQMARSTLVSVDGALPASTHPFLFPSPADGLADTLNAAGSDGTAAPTPIEVLGTDGGPNAKTGLLALEEVDEVAILAAPGITNTAVQRGLIDQCERLMDRFAVLDPVPGTSGLPATLDQIQNQAGNFDTRYAALYYPRLVIADPVTGAARVVAPSGHVIGIYARVDHSRGVHKAPANETINGIVDLETLVSKGQQEILNPRGINVLRDFRADRRGLRVFGARCLTSEQDWIYINVRRLFIFIEESLSEGTQWAVFEPNDARLWQRVRDSVSIFLTAVWRDGALMGTKPEEAFFVTCDRSTMSDDDILNGRLIMKIGIAPVRPAEFVIIQIGQWLGGSATQEL